MVLKTEPVDSDDEITEGIDSRFLISHLCDLVGKYMDEEQVQEVYQAYLFGHRERSNRQPEPAKYGIQEIRTPVKMTQATMRVPKRRASTD